MGGFKKDGHGGHPKAGAASRPIAGKRGSHKYCTGPETGYISVGAGLPAMRPVLTTGRWHGVRHGSKAVMRDWELPSASGPSPSPVIHLKQRRDNKRPLLFQILSHTAGIGGFKLNLEVLISLPK